MEADKASSREEEPGKAGIKSLGNKDLVTLALVFLLSLLPRVAGLTWGLPNAGRWYSYHPDESPWQMVGAVLTLLRDGGWNPHFFNYPSLTIYVSYGIYMVMAALGLTTQAVTQSYPWNVAHDIILAGRVLTAICGAGTAAATFVLARKVAGPKAGLWAAAFVALAPGFLQHSHFATVDVPATFLIVTCLALTYGARDRKSLLWAAAIAGLAAGAKYNAGLVLIAPLLALWMCPLAQVKKLGGTAALLGVACAVFLLTTPFALLDFREFWGQGQNGFAYELLRHPREGSGDLFTNTGNGLWYHLSFNLPFAVTWPLQLLGLAGVTVLAKERKNWPWLAFFALFLLSLGTSQVRFMRYVLPLVPVLCVAAAALVKSVGRAGKLAGAAAVAMLVLSLWPALGPLMSQDPRDKAAVLLEGHRVVLMENPWFYTPPFQPLGFNQPVPGVPVTGMDLAAIRREQPAAFTMSEFQWREKVRNEPDGSMAQFLANLDQEVREGRARLVKVGGYHVPWQRSFEPTDYLYTNPEVRVYFFQK